MSRSEKPTLLSTTAVVTAPSGIESGIQRRRNRIAATRPPADNTKSSGPDKEVLPVEQMIGVQPFDSTLPVQKIVSSEQYGPCPNTYTALFTGPASSAA
jgi:hypothetical protein